MIGFGVARRRHSTGAPEFETLLTLPLSMEGAGMTQQTGEAGEFQWFGPDELPDEERIVEDELDSGMDDGEDSGPRERGAPAAWRIAGALLQLRNEINALAPNRSKASDGTVGDPAHRARASRHNPNAAGVVTAFDCTDDPANGCSIHAIAEQLIGKAKAGQTNPAFEYVVSNGRIASRSSGWEWQKYTGKNPHTHHVHFAVGRGPDKAPGEPFDDATPWGLSATAPAATAAPAAAAPPADPGKLAEDLAKIAAMVADIRAREIPPDEGTEAAPSDRVKLVQALLSKHGLATAVDGVNGNTTQKNIKAFQASRGLVDDGKVGPKTIDALMQ
jgi:hypothetical protein